MAIKKAFRLREAPTTTGLPGRYPGRRSTTHAPLTSYHSKTVRLKLGAWAAAQLDPDGVGARRLFSLCSQVARSTGLEIRSPSDWDRELYDSIARVADDESVARLILDQPSVSAVLRDAADERNCPSYLYR